MLIFCLDSPGTLTECCSQLLSSVVLSSICNITVSSILSMLLWSVYLLLTTPVFLCDTNSGPNADFKVL